MWLPWQQLKVYLSSFAFTTSPIYFKEKSQGFKRKDFVVPELCSGLKAFDRSSSLEKPEILDITL